MTLDTTTLNEARELRSRLLELQHDADRAKLDYHHAIRRLHAAGGSMREIAEELDLSHQRVHQIVEGDEPIHARIGWQSGRRHRRGLRRFTRVARHVVMRAQKEAHALGSDEIAPEHVLIGLAAVERGTAARALAAQGVDVERARSEVGGEAVREPSRGRLPFSEQAKALLEASAGEAQALRHSWIGSEHILLALLGAGGRPVEVLDKLGTTADALRAEVERIVAEAA
jgi:Clp amino terminal domain, pathogenicity island component